MRMGSGVVQGDGGGGCAHAPQIATALAKTLDIKRVLFMVRGQGACQHHVSYATPDDHGRIGARSTKDRRKIDEGSTVVARLAMQFRERTAGRATTRIQVE
jgi:hypothetical protein